MQKPLTPFISSDPRFAPAPTPQPQEPEGLCECDDTVPLSGAEILDNKCERCGKALLSCDGGQR